MNLNTIYKWLLAIIVLSTPIMVVTVPHGGTVNYRLLILIGLFTGWKQVIKLNRLEVLFFSGFVLLFLSNFDQFLEYRGNFERC